MKQNLIKTTLWLLGAITALCSAIVVAGLVYILYFHESPTVYDTPWGKIDLDTAEVAMIDYYRESPRLCHVVHRDVIQKTDSILKVSAGDTVWYCLSQGSPTHYFYLVRHDSIGRFQIWVWDKYNKTSWPEVTKYFKQDQIFIR